MSPLGRTTAAVRAYTSLLLITRTHPLPLPLCPSVPLPFYPSVPLSLCTSPPLPLCPSVLLPLCSTLSASKVCCDEGFYASTGWDPLTGIGSVNYAKFAVIFGKL
jgi:hypothetical protein